MKYEATARNAAAQLGVPWQWLWSLVQFESGWRPTVKNPYSSARGLIQFVDSTARDLGYGSSRDLVDRHPTVVSQMPVVVRYLRQFAPFPTEQSLYMSVFRPSARRWPLDREFPAHVQRVNPGIKTVRDYVNKVRRRAALLPPVVAGGGLLVAALAVGAALYLLSQKGGKHG